MARSDTTTHRSAQIAYALPLLRQHARALTGSQCLGDACVVATIEAILRDPEAFDPGGSPRLALFRLFSDLFNALGADEPVKPTASVMRQALLLRGVQGFSDQETAEILRVDVPTVTAWCEQAARELQDQPCRAALIMEDGPLEAMDLESLLETLGHTVVGIARDYREAVSLAKDKQPTLLLGTMVLNDGHTGVDAVDAILRFLSAPVVFITAYPHGFLTGSRPEPVFVLGKPLHPGAVATMIAQAIDLYGDNDGRS